MTIIVFIYINCFYLYIHAFLESILVSLEQSTSWEYTLNEVYISGHHASIHSHTHTHLGMFFQYSTTIHVGLCDIYSDM